MKNEKHTEALLYHEVLARTGVTAEKGKDEIFIRLGVY